MEDEKKGSSKVFSDIKKKFIKHFGENIAVCSSTVKGKTIYVVFQFYTSSGDVHVQKCYPLQEVKDIKEILFTCGLAVNNASRLIKIKEAEDA